MKRKTIHGTVDEIPLDIKPGLDRRPAASSSWICHFFFWFISLWYLQHLFILSSFGSSPLTVTGWSPTIFLDLFAAYAERKHNEDWHRRTPFPSYETDSSVSRFDIPTHDLPWLPSVSHQHEQCRNLQWTQLCSRYYPCSMSIFNFADISVMTFLDEGYFQYAVKTKEQP